MSRILILASGTLGDALPCTAVASRLSENQSVTVATHANHIQHFTQYPHALLPFDSDAILASPDGQRVLEGGLLGLRRVYGSVRLLNRLLPTMINEIDLLARSARWDLAITAGMPIGTERVLLRAGIPVRRLYWAPHWPTNENISIYLSRRQRGGRHLNQLSHWLAQTSTRLLLGSQIKRKVIKKHEPTTLLDDPFHLRIPSWFALPDFLATGTIRDAQHASAIGFLRPLRFPNVNRAIEDAKEFKERNLGEPHVYAGFGSVKSRIAFSQLSLIINVARHLGIRVWTPKSSVQQLVQQGIKIDHLFQVDPGPHRQLFPLVDGVICHGGIGTIISALDSDRPLAISPHWFDQFHWAHKLAQWKLALAEYALDSCDRAARLLRATLSFDPDRDILAVCQDSCGLKAIERDVREVVS